MDIEKMVTTFSVNIFDSALKLLSIASLSTLNVTTKNVRDFIS